MHPKCSAPHPMRPCMSSPSAPRRTLHWVRHWPLWLGGLFLVTQAAWALPDFEAVRAAYRPSDALLLDRHGVVIQTLRTDTHGRRLPWTSLGDISPALREALVLSEDRHFYEHSGIDWGAVGSATWANLWNSRTRGASTLTMQLAGLLDADLRAGTRGRSVVQKIEQAATAVALEQTWRKDQILEAYLNLVTFRGEQTGIAALAATLFEKYPSGLDAREAAIAAVLVRAPNALPAVVAVRACAVLRAENQAAECVGLAEFAAATLSRHGAERLDPETDLAPHLARHLFAGSTAARIQSTLDAGLQRAVRGILQRQLAELSHRNVADGAAIVLDNDSGEVLAWVGSSGALSHSEEGDGVLALRQAGSTLKPFLYELAIEKRWLTAASILEDAPLDLSVGAGLYVPQDYERDFKGRVSVRTALGSSLNVPAVRTLMMVTPERFHERLVRLGLPLRETGDYYGLSLALGSAEVSLAALANAYRTLAEGGRYSAWHVRLGEAHGPSVALLDPRASFVVTDILSDRNARALTFGFDNLLNTPFWSAAKTGTSKDMRDNWCVGFSRRYTVAVWVGNDSGAPMWDVSGVSGAAPIWRAVLAHLEANAPARGAHAPPPPPAGVVQAHVRFQRGLEAERDEWFVAGTATAQIDLAARDQVAQSLISAPADHTIVALDPDIPPAAQHLRFLCASPLADQLRWRLDGRVLGRARALDWPLWPGRHELDLVGEGGVLIERVHFEVRGASVRAASQRPTRAG